jgi:transposase
MQRMPDGRRRFDRDFKIAAVGRVLKGESAADVAADLGISYRCVWRWKKTVVEKGEEHLYDVGRAGQWSKKPRRRSEAGETGSERRIAELERLVGRQQMEIRFLDRALRQVEELRRNNNDSGEEASSKE